jgi:hypothetical protein
MPDQIRDIVDCAYDGDVAGVEEFLRQGHSVNTRDPVTTHPLLHIAIGRNHLDLVRFLLDHGAIIETDGQGRWPSTVAEICEVDSEICDLVADAEAEAERRALRESGNENMEAS